MQLKYVAIVGLVAAIVGAYGMYKWGPKQKETITRTETITKERIVKVLPDGTTETRYIDRIEHVAAPIQLRRNWLGSVGYQPVNDQIQLQLQYRFMEHAWTGVSLNTFGDVFVQIGVEF